MRKKMLIYNTGSSLLNQLVVLICGFILPRFILSAYGSDVNGLVSSITQFLGFISFLDLGVGAVVQSAYYEPLANKDYSRVSSLFCYSKKFFRIVASILLIYVCVLCITYPLLVNSVFDIKYISVLIIIISLSSFSQYYFALPHQLLLNADQHLYIQANMQSISVILNTLGSVILIICGQSIHTVKLASSIIFLIRPIFLGIYVRKNYQINYKTNVKGFKIDQQWNGLAQHCATVVMNNTDVMVLTAFSSLRSVSIYSVYFLIVNGVRQLINSLSNGFNALLGNLLASKESSLLKRTFSSFEWLLHTIVVYIFSLTGVLIVPFIMNYTANVTDANYYQPVFGLLLTIANGIYCIRIPYNTMVCAAGMFRDTQSSALIEMVINIIASIVLVYYFDLIGVAIGTILAMTFRTIYFIAYLSRNVVYISLIDTFKQIALDFIQIFLIVFEAIFIIHIINPYAGYFMWCICAFVLSILSGITVVIFNFLFRKNMILIAKELLSRK